MPELIFLLGICSSITLIMSGLSTDRKRMLLFGITTSTLCALQYALNNSTVALVVCSIGIVRSLCAIMGEKYPVLNGVPFLIGFLTAQTVAFGFTADWNNFAVTSGLPLLGAYLGTAAVFFKRMMITKGLMISCGLVWMIYQFSAGLYTTMIGEAFTLFANTFALVMILRAEKAGASEEELKDIESQVISTITGSIPVVAVREALTGAIPVIRVTTDTKPLPVMSKVSVTKINFPETGSMQQVPA